MSHALLAKVAALQKDVEGLRAQLGVDLEAKLAEQASAFAGMIEDVVKALERSDRKINDLWVLRTAIAADVEEALQKPARNPIDPRKAKMPRTLRALGYKPVI